MKIRQHAPTTYTTDANGQHLAHVAMANTDQRATLYADDLERLLLAGFSPYWQWCKTNQRFRYVLANARTPTGKKRSITLARLIAGAGKGQMVEYIDGDRSNLRRDNLQIVRSSGRTRTPADSILPRLPGGPAGTCEAPQEAVMAAVPPSRGATPAVRPRKPQAAPQVAHVPRVIGRAALSARVRQQLTPQQ